MQSETHGGEAAKLDILGFRRPGSAGHVRTALLWLVPAFAGVALAADPTVTFTHDVAPLLYQHCTRCHHPNDVAPMSLITYKEARPWAAAMKEAVVTRKMPPWQADPHYGHFANDPRLSDAEIQTIVKWVQEGAPEGNRADLPAAPSYPDGWKIGKPDAIIPIPADYTVKPHDPDQYVYLRVQTNFPEDRWVSAVELRPGNRRIVHHAHVYLYVPPKPKTASDTAKKDDKPQPMIKRDGTNHINPLMPVVDDGCSLPHGGNAFGDPQENNILGSYLPGKAPDVFPEGYARKIPKGAVLEFQIHYNSQTITDTETDRTSVGVVFAKEPPKQQLRRVDVSNHFFKIPAGDPDHLVTACYVFPENVDLMSYTAHMHLRGKDMKFIAIHPDGHQEVLASVPNYDFNWQNEYQLAQPVPIEAGTKIKIVAHFDNSANNKYNPDPTKDIRWGEPSTEEMMDGWFEFILPQKPAETASIAHGAK